MTEGHIGPRLHKARTDLGYSLEEVAWRLRVRPELLRALEEDDFDEIGHHAFVRTHLRSYARMLGLEPSEIARAYRRHEPHGPSSIAALHEQEKVSRKHLPRSRWALAAGIAAVGLVSASLVGVLRGPGGDPAQPSTALPAGPRVSFEHASRAISPLLHGEQVTVRIAAQKATMVRVVVDGKRTFEGILSPGASRLFTAETIIEVSVADNRALTMWVNELRFTPPQPGAWTGTFDRSGLVKR